jgi:transketolase
VGDNIFDINIDFEDLGEDASNISLPKSLKAPSLKVKKNKAAQTSKKPLIKKVKSIDNKAVKKTDIEKPKTDVAQNNNHKLNNKNKAVSVTKTDSKYKVIDSLSSAGKLSKKSFHKKPDYRQKRINKTQELKKNITRVSSKTDLAENIIVKRFNLNNTYSNNPLEELEHEEPKTVGLGIENGRNPEGYNFGQLNHLCNLVRQDILDMLYHAGSGHSAGSLDQVEIMVALYFKIMRHDPNDPKWSERDILIQSNGHTVPVRYAVMARAGYFPRSVLLSLRKFDSILQGHPERMRIPALETTSGPLGSGLSQACGMALSLMMERNITRRIYCTMGDGELNEGNIWEAAMLASKYRLGNIIGIVDRNNIQIDGMAEDVMPMENLREKWEAFGWYVQEVDGNNIESVCSALNLAKSQTAKPNLIIAHTIPGKGVDFMEYDYHWHGKAPDKQQERDAVKKLRTLDGKIEGGNL